MPMADRDVNDKALDELFAQARMTAPEPSPELIARVMADAERLAARKGKAGARSGSDMARPRRLDGLLAWIADVLGGWRGVGGLATATLVGFWIGYTGLAGTTALTGGQTGVESVDTVELLPGSELLALAWDVE